MGNKLSPNKFEDVYIKGTMVGKDSAFATVHAAKLKAEPTKVVAAKILPKEHVSRKELRESKDEVEIMKKLGKPYHVSVDPCLKEENFDKSTTDMFQTPLIWAARTAYRDHFKTLISQGLPKHIEERSIGKSIWSNPSRNGVLPLWIVEMLKEELIHSLAVEHDGMPSEECDHIMGIISDFITGYSEKEKYRFKPLIPPDGLVNRVIKKKSDHALLVYDDVDTSDGTDEAMIFKKQSTGVGKFLGVHVGRSDGRSYGLLLTQRIMSWIYDTFTSGEFWEGSYKSRIQQPIDSWFPYDPYICATHQDKLSVTVKDPPDDIYSDTTEDHFGPKGQLWIVLIVILASIMGCVWIVKLASIYHEAWSDVTLWDFVVCCYHVMAWGLTLLHICEEFIFVHIFQLVGQTFLLLFTFTILLLLAFHFKGSCLQWFLLQWHAHLNPHTLQVPVQKVDSAMVQNFHELKPGTLKRKLAVILGVDKDRKGNKADVERFRKLLPDLGYDDIICPPNPTIHDMIKALQEVQTREEGTYEGLLVVIACHGSKGGILKGSDDQTIELKFLQWLVNGLIAPAFMHKPKLFIVNACRGNDEMRGIETDSPDDPKFTNVGTDFYTARSNIEDYLSYRSEDTGSYFLQAVADVWEKYYEQESLHDVMIKVRQKLLKQYKGRQVVECTETITKKIVNGMYIST